MKSDFFFYISLPSFLLPFLKFLFFLKHNFFSQQIKYFSELLSFSLSDGEQNGIISHLCSGQDLSDYADSLPKGDLFSRIPDEKVLLVLFFFFPLFFLFYFFLFIFFVYFFFVFFLALFKVFYVFLRIFYSCFYVFFFKYSSIILFLSLFITSIIFF